MTTKNEKSEQSNINQHGEFKNLVLKGLHSGGVHVVASKSHGKSRLLFSMVQELRRLQDCRTIIFDGSETWLYAFNRIETFTIGEHDIIAQKLRSIEEFERFELQNANLVKLALAKHRNLLFRLKTRKPSKRGFFVRQVVNYLDQIQRDQKAQNQNHEPDKSIAYFIEEAQDCFNSRSTARNDTEEFLTVFNEARNNKEAFYTASQRLNDFSKTIRSKQLYCIGKINSEDVTPFLKKLEKSHGLDFANMKPRQWYFEGLTFESPTFKQCGKPYQINNQIRQLWLELLPKKKTFGQKLHEWIHNKPRPQAEPNREPRAEKTYTCPSCGQECTKEEFESGFCLDCDTVEMGI